jgi:hypothetical protein
LARWWQTALILVKNTSGAQKFAVVPLIPLWACRGPPRSAGQRIRAPCGQTLTDKDKVGLRLHDPNWLWLGSGSDTVVAEWRNTHSAGAK